MISIEQDELNDMLFMAFRYAFGRSTYVTSLCGDLLIKYRGCLCENTRLCITKEIIKGINDGVYGMDMDRDEWLKVAEKLGGDDYVPSV